MAFSLKNIIFDFWGVRDKLNDVNKDVNGRGFNQRFIELLAEDLDANEISLINFLVENTRNPYTCFPRFIPYHENGFGLPVFSTNTYTRRKVVALIRLLNQRKGTKWGYTYLFWILGFTSVTITEYPPFYGFDSPTTFDDPDRVFDQKCRPCSNYSIALTGSASMTNELINTILTAIAYNEPINANLTGITYNGAPLYTTIMMWIDANGDLIFNNDIDPTFSATLDANGDVIFNGSNANFYSIDVNGNLVFFS